MKNEKEKKSIHLQTYLGFPISYRSMIKEDSQKPKEKGISLLIAMMAIALMVGLVADLILSSSVNTQLAMHHRDKIKAEYLAKSGENLAIFLLSVSWGIDLFRAQPGTPPGLAQELNDSPSSLWNSLNSFPPMGASSLSLIEASTQSEEDPFKLKGVFNEKIAHQMAKFEDQFVVRITDESSRINLNDCHGDQFSCDPVIAKLLALFNCPAEKAFLESKNITPEELSYRIKDFISSSGKASEQSGFGDPNTPYLEENPSYKIKEAPYDSLDELRLVSGWDDDIHKVFSPYLTVYPFPYRKTKTLLNLNTAPRELVSCLIPESQQEDCAENFAQKFSELRKNKKQIVGEGGIEKTLKDLACYQKSAKAKAQDPATWFDKKSQVFRITVEAQTGEQVIEINSVIRRIMPKEEHWGRKKQKIKKSYQILHWKMI